MQDPCAARPNAHIDWGLGDGSNMYLFVYISWFLFESWECHITHFLDE